jgi:hypothetical protein
LAFKWVDAGLEKLVARSSEKKLKFFPPLNKKPENQLISGFIFLQELFVKGKK